MLKQILGFRKFCFKVSSFNWIENRLFSTCLIAHKYVFTIPDDEFKKKRSIQTIKQDLDIFGPVISSKNKPTSKKSRKKPKIIQQGIPIETEEYFQEKQKPAKIPKTSVIFEYEVPDDLVLSSVRSFPLYKSIDRIETFSPLMKDDIKSISIFEGGYNKNIPSVSKVLKETMPESRKLILKRWETKKIKELGEEGFKTYRQGRHFNFNFYSSLKFLFISNVRYWNNISRVYWHWLNGRNCSNTRATRWDRKLVEKYYLHFARNYKYTNVRK